MPRFHLFLKGCGIIVMLAGCAEHHRVRPDAALESDRERWDVVYLDGCKIGYVVTCHTSVTTPRGPGIHWTQETQMRTLRFGQPTTQQVSLECTAAVDGALIAGRWQMSGGATVLKSHVVVDGDQLQMTTSSQGAEQTRSIPWPDTGGGYFCVEQSLVQRPMQPGETRQLRGLLPVIDQLAHFELRATEVESTEVLENMQQLLHIDSTIRLPDGQQIESQSWADSQGRIVKQVLSNLGQTVFRCDRETALREHDGPALDLGWSTLVPVEPPPPDPHHLQEVVYRMRWKAPGAAIQLPHDDSQSVRRIAHDELEITVRAVRPQNPVVAADLPSDSFDEYLSASPIVQVDDAAVQELAHHGLSGVDTPWLLAMELEQRVHETVETKDFSQLFASAADVARTRRGDCTEHAVLLTALCRARGIPTRVAMGLVYFEPRQQFAFHLWNEAWLGERWIPLDGTLGLGGIGAGHIKISTSSLRNTSGLESFLPLLQLLRQVELRTVSYR